jgi:hypothetical protein
MTKLRTAWRRCGPGTRSWIELAAVLEQLSAEDMERRIERADFSEDYFSPTPIEQLDVYREALLIFYGKASAYLRALSKPFPKQWQTWIG